MLSEFVQAQVNLALIGRRLCGWWHWSCFLSRYGVERCEQDSEGNLMRRIAVIAAFVVGVMLPASSAQAAPITFEGYSGSTVVATATFDIVGGNLQIILTNTSPNDVTVPSQILTAFFFDLAGVGALTPLSAVLGDGSTILFGPAGETNVGGEWAYRSGLSGAPLGATEGISSAGFGLFGDPNFSGSNLQDPYALNGMGYGITSAGDDPLTGNNAVTGKNDLIQNSVVFTLSGNLAGVNLSTALDPTKMSFQYGTSLTEPNVKVPEPSSMLLLTLALGVVGIARKRRKAA
jgi:PEP-CTERM motif